MFDVYGQYESSANTDKHIDTVELAMTRFLSENGRYPCPAPLNAAPDTAGFGIESSNDCSTGPFPGTFTQSSGFTA